MSGAHTRTPDAGDGTTLDLAEVAHRLRTPLTAIKGFADLLQVTDDPERVRDYVQTIRSNAALLDRMLAELAEGRMPRPPTEILPASRGPAVVPAPTRPKRSRTT